MGGRLDATNVVLPEIAVITSISLDHCEILGDTVEKIAYEKAGIIKPGRPVVLGHVPPAAEVVIREVAEKCGSQVYTIREALGTDISRYPETNLEGDYQRWNAATAALTARLLGPRWRVTGHAVHTGLEHVDWPGRWQRVTLGGRPVILDASHNPEGASVLETNLQQLFQHTGKKPIVITGVLGAARARPLLETISHYASEVHLVVPHQARACTHEELRALIPEDFHGRIFSKTLEELFPAKDQCAVGGPDDIVVVTGSIYLLGEILARIEPERGANEGRLQDF
jgi:dihydrofolate synthase/folylpolyglutamate synthase